MEKKAKELKGMSQRKSPDKTKNDAFCGGLDTLDLSEVQLSVGDEENQQSENSTEASETAEVPGLLKGEDPTSKITCKCAGCLFFGNLACILCPLIVLHLFASYCCSHRQAQLLPGDEHWKQCEADPS